MTRLLRALCALAGALWVRLACAAPVSDQIEFLPGYDFGLSSKMYSGYINVANGTRHLHYW
jgi:hypothetical protein